MMDRRPPIPQVPRFRSRFPAPPRRGGAESTRTLIVAFAFASVFALAYMVGTGQLAPSIREMLVGRAAPPAQQGDDDLTTGSIVFVPVLGNKCRQNLIDNATWQVREVGEIPCDQALAPKGRRSSSGPPTSRLEIIRDGFRK